MQVRTLPEICTYGRFRRLGSSRSISGASRDTTRTRTPTLVGGLRQADFSSSHRGCCSIKCVFSSYTMPSRIGRAYCNKVEAHLVFKNMDNKYSISVYPTNTNTWLGDSQWPKYAQHVRGTNHTRWTMTATVGRIGIHDDNVNDAVHISPSLWDQLKLRDEHALLLQPKLGYPLSSKLSALVCNVITNTSACI